MATLDGFKAPTPAAQPPKGPLTWPVYGLLRAISLLACVLPPGVVYAFGATLGAGFYALCLWREPKQNRRHRGALRNMRIAFGGHLDEAARRRVLWDSCLHVGALAIEVLRLPLLNTKRFRRWVDVREFEPLFERFEQGGVICASGHFGNWELLGTGAAHLLPLTTLARPCPEAGLERWLRGIREGAGQRLLNKYGGLWPAKKALQRGQALALNTDENARRGEWVPFCGVLAGTNVSAALLQRFTGCPIVVASAHRVRRERWRVHVWAVIDPDPEATDPQAEALRVTSAIAAAFEATLRRYPAQWLWSFRRWESRPPGEAMDAEGLPPRVGPALRPEGSGARRAGEL